MFCGTTTQVKYAEGGTAARPLRCRSWNCADCAGQRRKQLVALGFSGNPNRFLTLTVNPAFYSSQDERAEQLARAWRLLRKRLRRKMGWTAVPFLAVVERQKSGEPHLHILLRCGFIQQSWISEQMRELIGAPIVDIRWITDKGRVAAYVVKYCGKDPHRFRNTKRYWRSPDWVVEPWAPGEDIIGPVIAWEVHHCRLDTWINRQHARGATLAADEGWTYVLHYGSTDSS